MRLHVCAAFFLCLLVLGGGGSPSPLPELALQLLALLAIAAWALVPRVERETAPIDRVLLAGSVVWAAVIAVQLVPLPPALWTMFPGRETAVAAMDVTNQSSAWLPLSLSPYHSFASLLSLLPPLALAWMISRLTLADRDRLLRYLVAFGLVAAFLGVAQFASGAANLFRIYDASSAGFATGFQANRNATADVQLIVLIALVTLIATHTRRLRGGSTRAIAIGLAAFLMLSVLATGSRAGAALLLVPVGLALAFWFTRSRSVAAASTGPASPWWFVGGGILALAVIGVLVGASAGGGALGASLARMASLDTSRPSLWQDAWFAAQQYWPIGAGFGTFSTVFPAAESLEFVDASVPNRAHLDYLELVIEAGLLGLALLGVVLALLARRFFTAMRSDDADYRAHAAAAVSILVVIALHSLVDYPLRSMAVAGLFALAAGLLSLPVPANRADKRQDRRLRR